MKINHYKNCLKVVQEQTAVKKEKWKAMLTNLNVELLVDNDRVHNAKANQRTLIQQHLDETAHAKMMLQNYVDSLEEENDELHMELKMAISEKSTALQKSEKEWNFAKSWLNNWHAERFLHREAKDRLLNKLQLTRQCKMSLTSTTQ